VEQDLVKTDEMMERIEQMTYSVSALQNYVSCPAKFCYQSVLKLKRDEDVAESLDNAMIGNVYHNAMWALFRGEDEMRSDKPFEKLENQSNTSMPRVTSGYLESWLGREDEIKEKVISLMKAELNADEITGRDLVVQRVIVRYVMETIRKDILLLEKYGAEAFEIIGLEKKVYANLYGSRFFGVIDRVDSLAPGMVRMVDYKSGADSPSVIAISGNIENAVEKIFDAKYSVRKDNKAALQFHIYDRMAQASGIASSGDQLCNTMYSASELFRKVPQVNLMNNDFAELMDVRLQGIMDEIHDQSVPFKRTEDADACRYCDFKMICGR
jgi:CRISPR/Cas system-associated exonuclease Cas4 (RecB family)